MTRMEGDTTVGTQSAGRGVGGRVMVLEKNHSHGPRLLVLAVVVALACGALAARWIPAAPMADGRAWRMSGWDWLACWMHDRRMGIPGTPTFRPGVEDWRARRERDPGSVTATRGYLDSLMASGETNRPAWESAMAMGRSLVLLGMTNAGDVGRLLRTSLRACDSAEGLAVVRPWADGLSDADRALYLVMAADHGDWEEVGRALRARTAVDEAGRLVGWAWELARGGASGEKESEAARGLELAGEGSGETAWMAQRLRMACAVERGDAVLGKKALDGLVRLGAARLMDYLHEDDLRGRGRPVANGAREAVAWPGPVEWREVLPWTRWLRARGEGARARQELVRAAKHWDARPRWMEAVGEGLIQADWPLIQVLGDELVEGSPGVRDWGSLGHALRAMALEARGDEEGSRKAWDLRSRTPLPADDWPLAWCRMLGQLGRVSECEPWLVVLEKDHGTDLGYWRLRMKSAMGAGDLEAWLKAAGRAAALNPGDVDLVLDRAWGGLVLGHEPTEVLKAWDDDSMLLKGGIRGRLLMAWALARAGSYSRAEASLRLVEGQVKEAEDKAILGLAWFEVLMKTAREEEAWKTYGVIDVQSLPGPLSRWLDKEAAALGARLARQKAAASGGDVEAVGNPARR